MFSFKRFSEQFKINILQNAHRHGLFLLIVSLFLIIKYYHYFNHFNYGGFEGFEGRNMLSSALFVTSIMSIIVSIDIFKKLSITNYGIHYLMIPASTLEKYLAAWLYSTLFTFVIYITLYYIIHLLSMFVGNLITGLNLPYQHFSLSQLWEYFTKMMFIQSFYFLGAILFKKNSFVKTTACIFGCVIILIIIGSYVITFNHALDLSLFNINSTSTDNNVTNNTINGLNPEVIEHYKDMIEIILYIIPFICWSAAYIKLKRAEI